MRSVVSVVAVAQLVESRIVIPVVVGSSPIGHPTNTKGYRVFLPVAFFVFMFVYWLCKDFQPILKATRRVKAECR